MFSIRLIQRLSWNQLPKLRHLIVVDGGWRTCGIAGEILARVAEHPAGMQLKKVPARLTLPDAPAPSSNALERCYYTTTGEIEKKICTMLAD